MKYFTDVFKLISAKGMFALTVLMTFFCLNQTLAQNCNFASPNLTITINSNTSSNGFEPLNYASISGNLNQACTSPGPTTTNQLFWRDSGLNDIIEIVSSSPGANQIEAIYVSCKESPSGTFSRDTFLSGQSITFYSAVLRSDIISNDITKYDSVNVIININDVAPPVFTPPTADTTINCLADTSAYSINLVPTNVMDICSGVRDTILQQAFTSSGLVGDTCLKITRTWTFVDSSGVPTLPFIQEIAVIDTTGPFWDIVAINRLLINDPFNYSPTDTTLNVCVDTSITRARYDYFNTQFKPIAVDSCFGDTTLIPEAMVTELYKDLLPKGLTYGGIGCVDTLLRIFNAVDSKGFATGSGTGVGKFYLNLIIKDTTPPVVIDTPLVNMPNIIDLNGHKIDSFLVYVDSGMCSKTIDPSLIRIRVRDSISKDGVAYKWRVDPINGTMVPSTPSTSPGYVSGLTGGFSKSYDAAAATYPIGDYRITYIFHDSMCLSVDSFKFELKVRTWEPILIAGFNQTSSQIQEIILGTDTTLVFFNDANVCGITLDSSTIRILAKDTFENDPIIYRWKVKTISGTKIAGNGTVADTASSSVGVFRDTFNAAAIFYPIGIHELTYLFRDTSLKGCFNVDSIKYLISVRDTTNEIIAYDPFGINDVLINGVNVLTTHTDFGQCTDELNFDEPRPTDFTNCGLMPGATNTIVKRKLVSSPNPNIFSSIFGDPNGGSIDREFPIGETIFRYIFTDSLGSTDSITFNVTVLDTVAPVLACPFSIAPLPRNPVTCQVLMPDFTVGTVTECDLDTVMQFPPVGTSLERDTIVKLIAIDMSGNMDSCEFMIPLAPLVPIPLAPLPDTTTQCSEIILFAPQANVDCSTTTYGIPLSGGAIDLMTSPPSYSFTGMTNSTVTWLYNGIGGTFSTQSQTIIFVNDTTNPVTSSSSTTLYLDSLGMIIFTVDNLGITATDNCTADSNIIITTDVLSASCDTVNEFMVLQIFSEDESGNIDSTQFVTVRIEDNRPPDLIGIPNDTTLSCGTATPNLPTIQIRDNCTATVDSVLIDTVNTRVNDTRNSAYYNYQVRYIWTAVDDQNNTTKDSVVYTFVDILSPNIPFANPFLVGSAPDATNCSADVMLDLLGNITDNCSDTVYIAVDFSPTNNVENFVDTTMLTMNIPMGNSSIIIRARDVVGNETKDTLVIQVDDKTDPIPRCINALAIAVNAFGYVVIDSSVINQNSIDNCTAPNDLRFELSRDTFRCPDVGGTYEVIMTVIDEADNRHSCSSQVTIQDFTGTGSFACPGNVTINCDDSIDPEDTGIPTVTDICGDNSSLIYNDIIVAGSGGVCQIIQRTWVVTDTSGTQTTCVQFINLVDTIAPALAMIFSDVSVACIDDAATADSILVTDNCVANYYAHVNQSTSKSGGNLLVQKIWIAGDSCTTVIDTQIITIVDVTAPDISLPMDTFTYYTADHNPDSCGVLIPPIDFGAYVTDCNASLGLTVRHSDPDNDTTAIFSKYLAIGNYNMTVTARDLCGNTTTQAFVIQVIDNSIPTLVCVENLVVSLGTGGTGVLLVSNVLSSISDNCGDNGSIDTLFLSQSVFDCSDLGMNEVTLTAIDTSGNVGTCTVVIDVVNQGNTDVIDIALDAEAESISGTGDGMAWVSVIGGSGNYTYLWSPGGGTTDTIKNLAAGLYTVMVNDIDSGCRLTDTVRVNPGSTVNYTVCDVTGVEGNIIQVPIKVSNFTDILSVDLSFNISDPSVARFVNADKAGGFNLGDTMDDDFTFISDGRLLFAVNLDPTNGVTLPDGTVIFYVNVELLDTGTTTIFISGNSVADIETSALVNGSSMVVASGSTSGTITSDTTGGTVLFGGTVTLVAGGGLEGVAVELSGDAAGIDSTDTSGAYNFDVVPGQSLTVTPAENRNHNQGLTVTDLALIQRHILGIPLDSPYKILAADVNNSETITVTDLAIIQAVILGTLPQFIDVPSWKFIPAGFVLNATNPWANLPLPSSISTISNAANFIAFKMGDANYSATSVTGSFNNNENAESRATFQFGLNEQYLKAGDVIEVPFKAKDFKEMYAYQMTLNASPEWLSFEGVSAGALTDISAANFGLVNAEKGLISTLWYSAEPLNIEQNTTLFTISFRVNRGGKYLSDILRASSDMLLAEAHTADAPPKNINLTFDKNAALSGFELFQNKPNPFSTETTISFNLPKAAAGILCFYDFSGRMVHRIKGDYTRGINNVVVHKNDLSGSGVLYYELATPTFTARKKMIVLD